MYHIYTTDGIVLRSRNIGEDNKLLSLYTRDLGRVDAVVQSLRTARSRLRPLLQMYSFASVSLVYGKSGWRVTTASLLDNPFYTLLDSRARDRFIQALALLERLTPGEQCEPMLFETLVQMYRYLEPGERTSDEIISSECLTVLRILYRLGYIGDESMSHNLLADVSLDAYIPDVTLRRGEFIKMINASLHETGL